MSPHLQFLKAVRLRVEMRWSAEARGPSPCCGLENGSPSAASSDSAASGSAGVIKPSGSKDSELAEVPTCCGGGGAAVAPDDGTLVPTSRRAPWRRGSGQQGALACCGVQLITRAQARRNFWRAVFTFVVMLLDYCE